MLLRREVVVVTSTVTDWDQPTLHSPAVKPDEWDRYRVPAKPRDPGDAANAGDLVARELCTPQCLLSCSPRCRLCACSCKGRYHAALAGVSLGEVLARAAQVAAREDPHILATRGGTNA